MTSGRIALMALLLCQSALAAEVRLVPSTTHPKVGESFHVTVKGSKFPAVFGATLGLRFDDKVVSLTGVALEKGSPFTTGVIAKVPFAPGDQVNLVGPLIGDLPTGDFAAFRMNFTAVAPGASDITLVEDGTTLIWMDEDRKQIPVSYQQAKVEVGAPSGKKAKGPQAVPATTKP